MGLCYNLSMLLILIILLMLGAVVAAYFKIYIIYGLIMGVVLTYLFITERLFKKSVGRVPTVDEEIEMFKHLFKR